MRSSSAYPRGYDNLTLLAKGSFHSPLTEKNGRSATPRTPAHALEAFPMRLFRKLRYPFSKEQGFTKYFPCDLYAIDKKIRLFIGQSIELPSFKPPHDAMYLQHSSFTLAFEAQAMVPDKTMAGPQTHCSYSVETKKSLPLLLLHIWGCTLYNCWRQFGLSFGAGRGIDIGRPSVVSEHRQSIPQRGDYRWTVWTTLKLFIGESSSFLTWYCLVGSTTKEGSLDSQRAGV
jgi:hypothetical protein